MKNETWYEWDVETWDPESGDVLDHDHEDELADLLERHRKLEPGEHLVLVWNVGNEEEGVRERGWAYVENGELPDVFDGGPRVPARFRTELRRALAEIESCA